MRRKQLDGDQPFQSQVASLVDHSHAAAELLENRIVGYGLSNHDQPLSARSRDED
jgi:hypothetical protein